VNVPFQSFAGESAVIPVIKVSIVFAFPRELLAINPLAVLHSRRLYRTIEGALPQRIEKPRLPQPGL
jgi:hypothetical protein